MRIINRLVGAGLLLALALSAAGHGVAVAQGQRGLRVVKRALKPTSLPGSGGLVFVSVQVTSKGAAVETVAARAEIAGSSDGQLSTLGRRGNTYQGQVRVPANSTGQATTARIVVYVTTTRGADPGRLLNPRIKLGPGSGGGGGGGGDGELPPPPPPP